MQLHTLYSGFSKITYTISKMKKTNNFL